MSGGAAAGAWSAGRLDGAKGPPRVLFGRMYEDPRIEQAAFAPGGRVVCIASAGCTAMHLSGDHEVVAVDINPAQVDYASRRIAGMPMAPGSAEKLMRLGRALFPLAGWHAARLREFVALDDPAMQAIVWKREFDTRRFRVGLDMLLSPATLRAGYSSRLVASLPARFAEVMRSRMERCFARHPNRTNPFVRALLLGETSDDAPTPRAAAIRVARADAAEFLEQGPEQGFDGFTLSNILDGADGGYRERLFRAVARAAKPGAVAVLRSFAEPSTASAANRAIDDRSMLWGVVQVSPAATLR
jgi:S-adenosylmethionine:diacylglycerol 3-amino-3-carboxypropyl transferase